MAHADESSNPWDSHKRTTRLELEMAARLATEDLGVGVFRSAYLARSDVARLLGVSPNTVTRWAREGRLPSHLTLGGHHRFDRTKIEEIRASLQR